MKILFISNYFYPEGNAPATRVYEMTRRWAKAGHDVTVVTAVPNVPAGIVYEGFQNKWRQEEDVQGVRVIRVWTYLAANAGTGRRIASYLSFMLAAFWAGLRLDRPDVVIATSPQFFCGWGGWLLATVRRLPFVLEVRDLWPDSIVAVGAMKESVMIGFLQWLELKLYAGAARIVTVGDSYRDRLLDRGVDPAVISVVPNGVDLASFTEINSTLDSRADFRAEFGLGDRFVCAYVGTIGMAAGLGVVLRAADLLQGAGRDDVCFLLVGDGANRVDLQHELEERSLSNVRITGRLPKSRIPEVLASVDACLVHLIKTELFRTVIPSKIFEAAAMQKPIILGIEGTSASLVSEAGAGICIEPENEFDLVAAVDQLARHPEQALAMGAAGLEFVSRRYNYDLLADQYLSQLNELLDGA